MRFFNTNGPVNYEHHYSLPPLERVDLNAILRLIQQQKYFALHAPRQTGKTSTLLALAEYLNQQSNYFCVYGNVEAAQSAGEDVHRGIQTILSELSDRAQEQLNMVAWQTWTYMDKISSAEGHLIIFDRDEGRSWQEKIFRQERVLRSSPSRFGECNLPSIYSFSNQSYSPGKTMTSYSFMFLTGK